jgi:hypothetical protein
LTRLDWLKALTFTTAVGLSLAACRDDDDRVRSKASRPKGEAGNGAVSGNALVAGAGGQGANAAAGSAAEGGAVNRGSPAEQGNPGGMPELGGEAGNAGDQTSVCYVEESYGDLGNPNGTAVAFKTNGGGILYTLTLEVGPPPDEFRLELYKGLGVFKDGLTTGVFPIVGDELNYGTCGVCPIIYENKDISKLFRGAYIATSGTVTLTSVDGKLIGDMKDVTMEHVTIDNGDFHSVPATDHCVTKIDSLNFSAIIQ